MVKMKLNTLEGGEEIITKNDEADLVEVLHAVAEGEVDGEGEEEGAVVAVDLFQSHPLMLSLTST